MVNKTIAAMVKWRLVYVFGQIMLTLLNIIIIIIYLMIFFFTLGSKDQINNIIYLKLFIYLMIIV